MNDNQPSAFTSLYQTAIRYLQLELDYARLTAAEKLSVLLSTIALYSLIVILGVVTLLFISIGVGHLLASTIAPHMAYLIVSAFYLLLLVLLVIFRKELIFNPAARFISKLFVKAPDQRHEK